MGIFRSGNRKSQDIFILKKPNREDFNIKEFINTQKKVTEYFEDKTIDAI